MKQQMTLSNLGKNIALIREKFQSVGSRSHSLQYTLQRRFGTLASKILLYTVLIALSFVFLYPLLYLISQSLMLPSDVSDSTVQWVPKQFDMTNYTLAWSALGGYPDRTYWDAFMYSVVISFGSAFLQVFSCALAGYALGRYRFPGYTIILSLVLFSFLVPPQTILVPLFQQFSGLGWINTFWPFIVPSAMGHGVKGALFVLIFIQFFHRLPSVLEEAARIDGASSFRTFGQIMLPLARPAMLVVFLFSVVWHWNDMFYSNLYLRMPKYYNLSQTLGLFNGVGAAQFQAATAGLSNTQTIGAAPTILNQVMAASLLTILPMLVMYLFTQRYFVESVERTGIAGE